jgi:hypothetical protein
MPKKKTNDEFLYDLKLVTDTLLPLEQYINAKTKISIQCKVCGNIFAATPDNLLRGKGCPICALQCRALKRRKTHEEFIREMEIKHPELVVNSQYITVFDKVNCTCKICNTSFDGAPANMLYGTGCPKCGDRKIGQKLTKPFLQFKKELYNVAPTIMIIGEYVKQSSHIRVKCGICGHEWNPTGTSLLLGFGCPMCANSHGEKQIDKYLHNANIKHEHQKTYDNLLGSRGGLLSYDFYLPDYNLLIEYQGEYHDGTARNQTDEEFARQVLHDKLKAEYVDDNNIELMEIWYYDYDNIEHILNHYFN